MKKTLVAFGALIVLAVAAALVAPYFVGVRAESAFRADVADLNARNTEFQLAVTEYRRGFYSSQATVQVRARTAAQDRFVQLLLGSSGTPEIHVHIDHGPIAIAALSRHFNLAPVLFRARVTTGNLPPLSLLGALKPVIRAEAWLTGGDRISAYVPPGQLGVGVAGAKWHGAHATVDVDSTRTRMRYAVRIEPVDFEAMDPDSGRTVRGTLQPISWSGRRHRAVHGLWIGRGEVHARGLTVTNGGEPLARIAAGRGTVSSDESGDGRWLDWRVDGTQTGGVLRGWKWSHLEFEASAEKLDAAGVAAVMHRLDAGAAAATSNPSAFFPAVAASAVTAQTNATLHLRLVADEGEARADGTLEFAATAAAPAAASPLGNTRGRLEVSFPTALVPDFAGTVMSAEARAEAEQHLAVLVRTGYLDVAPGGLYTATVAWTPHALTVNGHPLMAPPPAT